MQLKPIELRTDTPALNIWHWRKILRPPPTGPNWPQWIHLHQVNKTSWCLNQPIWNILVKMGSSSPNSRGEHKKCFEPPPFSIVFAYLYPEDSKRIICMYNTLKLERNALVLTAKQLAFSEARPKANKFPFFHPWKPIILLFTRPATHRVLPFLHNIMQPPPPGSFRPVGSGSGKGPSTPVSPLAVTPTTGRSLDIKRSNDHGLSIT